MTRNCSSIGIDSPLSVACDLLVGKKISELPVVDRDGKPVGLVDITDIVGIVREEPEAATPDAPDADEPDHAAQPAPAV